MGPTRQPRSIFITGAAAGIGRATAERFAREGWFVGLFDVDEAGLQSLAAQLQPGTCYWQRLDVTDAAAWSATLDQFWRAAGERLDVLFNNAGIIAHGPFGEVALTTHQRIAEINFKSLMTGCHAALPYLRRTPGSRVINMASSAAMYGQPQLVSYAASKFAVRGLTEGLDLEWEPLGIRVMDVWPLFVQTAMVKGVDIPSLRAMGVKLTPDDVAATIWKLAHYNGWLRRVHWPVGFQAWLTYRVSSLFPDWLVRWINRLIATQ